MLIKIKYLKDDEYLYNNLFIKDQYYELAHNALVKFQRTAFFNPKTKP